MTRTFTARLARAWFGAGTPAPGATITLHGVSGRVVAVRDLGPDEVQIDLDLDLEPEDPPSLLGIPGDNQLTIEDTP
jgi:hypothetical protein